MKLRYRILHTPDINTLAQVEDEQGKVLWSRNFTAQGLFEAQQYCTHSLMGKGIVPVYESVWEDGSKVITTQFIEGESNV